MAQEPTNVQFDINSAAAQEISPLIYGGFIEFLRDFVNGPLGMWAQEIPNRGFDDRNLNESGLSGDWRPHSDIPENYYYSLIEGGYNPNGKYYVRIGQSANHFRGVRQTIYVSPGVKHDFYIYAKSASPSDIRISFRNSINNSVVFSYNIKTAAGDWRKYRIDNIPEFGAQKIELIIQSKGAGNIYFDEASLVPQDNVLGMRREYYELFESWKPNILRYPGGWFADIPDHHWELGIGDIDKRGSVYGGLHFIQRIDFGIDEFMEFCNSLDIEPHIVVNFNRDREEASNWLEYCNANADTPYGKIRADNGHPEPYAVKYWEIGNEQWGDETEMSEKYLLYYNDMKQIDSSAQIIINGDLWRGKNNFDAIISTVGDKCQIFGWHLTVPARPPDSVRSEKIYESVIGAGYYSKSTLSNYRNWLEERNLSPRMQFANTEWWIEYGTEDDWLLDTNVRASSLEAGLSVAAHMIAFQNNPKFYRMAEKTIGLGCIRTEIDTASCRRRIFGTPQYQALRLFSNNSGDTLIPTAVYTEKFSVAQYPGLWAFDDIPYIQVSATKSNDPSISQC
ncbi:MAG: hypothetical protein ACLFQX_02420 [Candidatus Kapaibacterium sp.]